MMLALNLFMLLAGCLVLWWGAGVVVRSVEKFSSSINVSSFTSSVFILGFLTSLGELSVGLNAIIEKRPGIFVGNLIGGGAVLLLFIIPILVIANRGISLRDTFDANKLFLFMVLIAAPSLVVLDGQVSRFDALLILALYGMFFYLFQRGQSMLEGIRASALGKKQILKHLGNIAGGAAMIFLASKGMVEGTIFLADALHTPAFFVSLIILAFGTNLPEISIALKSILTKKTDIAFGDYIGSAAANMFLFGIFSLLSGPFTLVLNGFAITFYVILLGYAMFFLFAKSKYHLSVYEGLALFGVFIMFLLFEITQVTSRL